MASTIFRLDSRVFSTWSVKNRLQLLHDSLRSRLRGTIQRQVISTSTVFSTLIRVKSRKGRKWDTRSACGGIVHVDGNVLHHYISPCGEDDGFQLKFIFGGVPAALHIHFAQRVKAVSRLCIFQFQPGFQSEPEIREFIGKGILARHIVGG